MTTTDIDGESRVAFVTQFLDKITQRDLPGLQAMLHPEFRYELAYPVGELPPTQDPAEFMKMIERVATLFDFFRMIPGVFHPAADPELVIAEYAAQAVTTANQLPYDNHYVGLFWIRDGKLVTFREYADSASMGSMLAARKAALEGSR